MNAHFNNFTPEAMRAFRHQLDEEVRQRLELINHRFEDTSSMLADFRKRQMDAEAQRRQRAAREADKRRQFMSKLRSRVHSLRGRFDQARKAMIGDLQQLNQELRDASESFRAF